MRHVYLDYNATTPIHPLVSGFLKGLLDGGFYGNPSSAHATGREARSLLDEAREHVAALIKCHPDEIVFNGGGTEGDNHAIKGLAYARSDDGGHIITTVVEHPAVLNTCRYLEGKGFRVTYLPVDEQGVVDPDDVKRAIRGDTTLISVMLANNETGTLMPIREIGSMAREYGILLHSDMVQALGKIKIDVNDMNVDLASFSGHKMYTPKGVGAFFMRRGVEIDNLIHGAHQEGGRRPGTEGTIGIAAFGKACQTMGQEMDETGQRVERLRSRLFDGIQRKIDGTHLFGHPDRRLPNTIFMGFEDVESESLLIGLDMEGISVSSGAACSSGVVEPSHVLLAMGIPLSFCRGAIRMSLGRETTEEDINYVLDVLPTVVSRLRQTPRNNGA
ncbi:MAG TPA: cysteine desulfurase NifS [Deltaproteobacteria bacterium]|nr:cysteine desulfurase NifS [Deltaproteobacteria bacterium]